jgi:hypothetical protein
VPIYEVTDPLGRIMEVEGSSPPSPMQIQGLFERYDSEKEERLAEERTIPGQIFETVKAVPRGFAGSFLTAGEGLAELADVATNFVGLEDLIDSGEENELVRLSREGRASLQEAMGADEAYRDTWMTKFGEGLGSFATFFTPAAALKVAGATGKIAGVAQTAGTGSLAVGMGAGEQAQRIQAAREQGIEVSEGDEDWAIFTGSGIGLSELLPVNRLLRRISADVDPATKIKIKERITGALATGGLEGLQETLASIFQDATERGFYNENLPATDMESLFDEFTIGGAVGTFADLALNGAAGRRRQMAADAQTESQADEKEALDKSREDLSERVSAAMAAEAESQAGIPAPIPTTLDPAEIDRPSPTQIQSAVGTRLLTPGRYLSIRGPDGEIFQAEEKVSFKRDRRNPDRRIEERYVRKVNDDGSFSTITIARDGNPISGIEVEEISPAPETIRSKRKDDPSLQYARHVRRLLGDDLLKAGSFTFTEERSADGVPVFRAVDSMGQRYGKAFETKEEAATFAGNLNSQLIEANVSKSIEDSIDASDTDITSLDQKEAMFMYGYRILHPDQNLITSAELDQAGETTVATGFEEAAIPNSELGNYAPSKLTMSQRVNRKRLAQGKSATNMFTIQEAKSVLKDNFGNLRTGEIETETYAARKGPDGKPVVVSSAGEVITGRATGIKKKTKDGFEYQVRPFTSVQQANAYAQRRNKDRNLASIDESVFANKKVRQKEIEKLLEAKNISTQVGSSAFRTMMEAFTGVKASGRKRLKDLSNAEMKVLYQKIRSLPAFTETTELVDFNLQPMKPIDYKLEPQAKTSPVSLAEQVPQTLALTDPAAQPVEGLDQIQSKLNEAMKSVGLSDIKANINHSLRNVLRDANGNLVFGIRPRSKEDQDVTEFGWQGSGIVVETSPDAGVQAMYSNAANEIFLGMDRLDSSKPIDQQVDEALELLAHEQVHAMRTMNLFTDKEWETLSKAAANRKSKTEPDKTFLEIAAREYANRPDEVIIEEAVAELVRVSRKDPKVVSGKPKSLIKKIYNFLADLIGFRDSTGFESFQDLIADIETGVVGARERGGRVPVEARRTAEEVAEETRTPDFLPEMVEEEVEGAVDEAVPLADRYARIQQEKALTPDRYSRRITDVEGQGGDRDRGRDREDRRFTPLEGTPDVEGKGPIPEIVEISESYAERNGIPYQRQQEYVKVDPERATKIAEAYENMPHEPNNPEVKEAYEDLIKQTKAQYDALVDNGYKFTFFDGETDPYAGNPFSAMRDLRYNKTMAVYGTYDGYGTEGITDAAIEDNPLLEDTGMFWQDQNGVDQPVTANDLFRAVHDALGHGIEGSGFRARGEENAWLAHSKLFTGPALKALTSETRGQNSWVNYGPYGEANQTAKVEDTVFAEQKAGIMPSWTWTDEVIPAPERERADGTTVGGDTDIQKITRDSGVIKKVVEENEKAAVDTPASFVPEFNYRADPEAQYVARNPEEGLPPNPNLLDRYSRKNSPELSQNVKNVVNRIAPEAPPNKTPGETYLETTDIMGGDFNYWVDKVRQASITKWSRLERIARLPQFKENLADTSAIAAAIFSDRSMGIVGSALKSGVAVYRNGVVKVEDFYHTNKRGERKKYRGLVDVMAPLFQNKYGVSLEELAQAYAVARRAEGMRQRGLPTPAKAGDLALIEAEIAKYVNENGDSIIEEWYDTWQAYNNKTVEFMKATGLVDDALAQKWLEMSDYIPFYRQGEAPEGEIANLGQDVPSMFKSGMTTAFSFKKLRGSEKGVNVPMLDAITRNLSMAIDAGMKNVAQQRIVRDMATIGLAKKATPAQIKNKKQNFVVSFKVQGKDQHYKVDDPLLYESLQPLESGGLATSLVAKPSKFLRELITREPGFILANMMRDTLSAYTTSGADFVPVIDTVKNFGRGIEELESFGVVGGYDFGNDPEDIVEAFAEYSKERGIDVEGGKTGLGMFKKLWNAAGRATTASDAATRRAVYNDVLARTGNEAEAAFQALEVINFSRRGRSPVVRFMTAGIPFLNARVQGLDVLYRGFMGYNPANREKTRSQAVMTAIARGGLITASTVAYWLLVSDDDQYKDTPDEQKDLNWLIPTPMGIPVRIPVPFEVGFIFKTIPERILDTYPVAEVFGKPGATSGRELTDSVLRGIGSTFELNPLGIQAIAPLVEATMNYNFFTGREIVPLYASKKPMQGLVSRESNMEVSKWIGEAMNVSPMKVDHVLYGYTGTLGSYLLDSIDHLVAKNPVFTGDKTTSAPSKAITELPVLKRFFVNEFSSDNRSDFYRLHNAVTGMDQAIKSLDEQKRFEEAEALIRTQGHLLDLKHDVNYISNRLSKLRKERTEVERSDASSELKRELLLQINKEMDALTQDVPLLKKYAGLPAFPRFQLWGT